MINLIVPMIAAFTPTLLYTLTLWWLDRYEKEPLHLLLVTFVWGAVPALIIAIFAELAVDDLAQYVFGPGAEATIVAPIVEELLKALVLIALFVFVRREFNGVLDGIIYGALVGFGFAMSENILYFMAYSDQIVGVWLLRSVIFGFNHAFFTSIVGIALGLVRYEKRRWAGYVAVPLALWLAIMLHALHNSSAQIGFLSMLLAWVVNGGGILIVLATIVLSQRHELQWLNSELDEEVAIGVITLAQFERILSPTLRSRAEVNTLLTRGWKDFRELRRFNHLLTELAFVKYQLRQRDRFCCFEDVLDLRHKIQVMQPALEEHGRHTVLS